MAKPKTKATEASNEGEIRRHKPFILPEAREDHLTPAERLAEHRVSKAHLGPDAGGTVRLTTRGKLGDESQLVRGMYDIANKPKRRSRRRKEHKS